MSGRHSAASTLSLRPHPTRSAPEGASIVHRIPAWAKLVGLFMFVSAVAVTHRSLVAVFAVDAVVLGVVAVRARISPGLLARRLMVIAPFVVSALLLPFLAEGGPKVEVLGRSLSVDGSWAAWNVFAKASLGATASIIVTATTSTTALIAGLGRLRVPAVLVAIVSFMFRYLDLLSDELGRMRLAMVARCHDPRWLWQVRPVASSAGALFVRSYERGERVHQAMAARGFTGTMPAPAEATSSTAKAALAFVPGLVAWVALAVALLW